MCQARGSWAAHCFCISPGPNGPRSPPFLNEPQSLRISAYLANASSVLPSAAILSMYVWSSAMAASPLTFAVDSLVRRETGLREPLNLMRRWRAAYFGISVTVEEAREEEEKCPQWREFRKNVLVMYLV